MKKTLTLVFASAALMAGCATGSSISYTIQGQDPSFVDGKWMYVLSYAGGRETVIDSARIENHSFTMKGRYPYPVSAYLYMGRDADGIQISKKLVSTSGWLLSAMFTLVHTVNTVSLLQLSHRSRSSSIITLPVMAMF